TLGTTVFFPSLLGAAWVVSCLALTAPAQPATEPATDSNWNPAVVFDYRRPAHLQIEESTPTTAQVNFLARPPQDPNAPLATTGAAQPLTLPRFNALRLRFRDLDGEIVPLLLCTPKDHSGRFPLIIALHGMGSNKAQVCAQLAPAFTAKGFAVLALDLPLHGE